MSRRPLPPVAFLVAAACAPLRAQSPAPAANTAVVPVSKLEDDSYDWFKRHDEVLALQKTLDPEIVLIGDSITHFWAGLPPAHSQNGPRAWATTFGARRVLNMGFGWDRAQNVLWRLDHGEMDGTRPKLVVINIGTNNFGGTPRARENTPPEIAQGIEAIVARVQAKSPFSRIVVMGVFPRGNHADDNRRPGIRALNEILARQLANRPGVTFLDIGARMISPDGSISSEILRDGTHPGEKGYEIWGRALLETGALR